jgi:hypothetical protein
VGVSNVARGEILMKEFIHKINSNKFFKIIFCIVVAIPIWLIMTLLSPKDSDVVPAEVVIATEPTTITISSDKDDNSSTTNEITEEKLNFTTTTDDELLKVITVGEVDFTEKYITENIREDMLTEILSKKQFKNVSRDQVMNLKLEKHQGNQEAFIETAVIKDNQYVAAYILVEKNLVYAGSLYSISEPESLALENINIVIDSANLYIQQAREAQ